MDYAIYIRSEAWHQRAAEAKARAGHECALCPETRGLEVHHRTYDRLGDELPTDLVVLCWWCHRRHHGTFLNQRRRTQRPQQQLLPFDVVVPSGADLN